MNRILHFALVAAVLAAAPRPLPAQPPPPLFYRDFSIDDSAVADRPSAKKVRPAIKAQVDMVLAVGLPPAAIESLRRVKIVILPDGSFQSRTPGRYIPAKRQVEMVEGFMQHAGRPVLLHELMHGYQHQILPDGAKNSELVEFFARAGQTAAYSAKSHMMSNIGEFFACTTTAYLYGATAQEPFTREKIRQSQPNYFAWLQARFGPDAGNFEPPQ